MPQIGVVPEVVGARPANQVGLRLPFLRWTDAALTHPRHPEAGRFGKANCRRVFMNAPAGYRVVLVADDYDHVAELTAELVRTASPYDAIHATDGLQAVLLAEQTRPFVCILDIDMPIMNGIVAARSIRALFADKPPALIAVTGGATLDDDESARPIFDHVLKKPLAFAPLLALLHSIADDESKKTPER